MHDGALRAATVAAEVRAAFADAAERPAPPCVRPDKAARDYRGFEAILASHQGLPTLEVLERHASSTSLLTPIAERWFWRSLLLAAIETLEGDDPDDRRLFWTVRALTPNPCDVVTGATDYGPDDAQAIRERFTPTDRVAVARFLRLVIEALAKPELAPVSWQAYYASKAIVWCWTDDPGSTRTAEALRAKARSYTRPPADDPFDQAVIDTIEHAFADTPPPSGALMEIHDEEGADHAIAFDGADWRTLAPWFLDCHGSAFSFMTPAAFRYFLPTLMCQSLVAGTLTIPEFHLVDCIVNPSPYRDACRARILTFSAPERAAVADFLRNSTAWSSHPEAYKTAVYDFWDPRTAGAAAVVGEPPLTRASVEADIREAFVGAEVRPAAPLIRCDADLEDNDRRELEAAFEPRGRLTTPRFLAARAPDATNLRPAAESWFWRSFLLSLLEAPWDHTDRKSGHWSVVVARVDTAVDVLTPMHDEGSPDDDARSLRRRFTSAQRIAIARFLRLVIEERAFAEGPLAYLASQAIAWCWRDDPASTDVAQAVLERARPHLE